jgi:4'-phosphopantetheinyl transferase EntD
MSLLPLVAVARVVERRAELTPEELVALGELPPESQRMVAKRRAEFALGRHCAKHALAELGITVGVVPIAEERAPAWPDAVVGAITHCTGYAAAAVAPRAALRGIGIDAQPVADAKSRAALQRTATDAEIRHLNAPDEMTARTIAFAAKECVFKALAPTVGGYFGFEAATVVTATDAEVTLELARTLHASLPRGTSLAVRWHVREHVVFAALEWA